MKEEAINFSSGVKMNSIKSTFFLLIVNLSILSNFELGTRDIYNAFKLLFNNYWMSNMNYEHSPCHRKTVLMSIFTLTSIK